MICLWLQFFLLIFTSGIADAAGIVKINVKQVKQPLIHKRVVKDTGNTLLTRANQEFADKIENQKFFYSANVAIGTPPQALNLLLDTGSSDTWVFTPQTKRIGSAKPSSVFDPSQSKTYRSNGTSYSISYGIGRTTGNWGTDRFTIGGATLRSQSFGIATRADTSNGIIGIGRAEAESTYKNGYIYENLPMRMASEGLINSAAYSLYLNDLNSREGTILFGGVDLSKFVGNLHILPVSHPRHLGITLQTMRSDGRVKGDLLAKPQTAVLDSGTSLSYFPSDAVDAMHEAFNANPSFTIGEKYYCDCNVTNNLILNFGSAEIAVRNYQFLWPIEQIVNPLISTFAFPPNSCYIGIEKTQSGMDFILLGDNFLRSFYIVYDLRNNRIAIAQANPMGRAENLQPITKTYIPGAV